MNHVQTWQRSKCHKPMPGILVALLAEEVARAVLVNTELKVETELVVVTIEMLVGWIVVLGRATPLGPNTKVVPPMLTVVVVAPVPILNVVPLMTASVWSTETVSPSIITTSRPPAMVIAGAKVVGVGSFTATPSGPTTKV